MTSELQNVAEKNPIKKPRNNMQEFENKLAENSSLLKEYEKTLVEMQLYYNGKKEKPLPPLELHNKLAELYQEILTRMCGM